MRAVNDIFIWIYLHGNIFYKYLSFRTLLRTPKFELVVYVVESDYQVGTVYYNKNLRMRHFSFKHTTHACSTKFTDQKSLNFLYYEIALLLIHISNPLRSTGCIYTFEERTQRRWHTKLRFSGLNYTYRVGGVQQTQTKAC